MDDSSAKQLEAINRQIMDLVGIYRAAVGRLGMSENELWIWYSLIAADRDCSQQDICAMWSMSKQTVNTIISNMARKGLVSLEMIPGTRNKKKIRLTVSGREYGERVVRPLFEVERRAIEKLSDDERTACTAAFRKYISFLRAEMGTLADERGGRTAV